MKYQLNRLPSVSRQIKTLPGRVQQEVNRAIADLEFDPYLPDAEGLREHYQGIWKITIDGWRILYRVHEADHVVTIITVKRRDRNTYTRLFSLLL